MQVFVSPGCHAIHRRQLTLYAELPAVSLSRETFRWVHIKPHNRIKAIAERVGAQSLVVFTILSVVAQLAAQLCGGVAKRVEHLHFACSLNLFPSQRIVRRAIDCIQPDYVLIL